MRARRILLGAMATALLTLAGIRTATAQTDGADEPVETVPSVPAGAVTIGDSYAFNGATILDAGGASVRTLDAYHAAVYVQSWLAEAFFGNPLLQEPPEGVPVFRVDVAGLWGNQVGTVTTYYATDAGTVWMALPTGVNPTPPGEPTPPPSNWFVPEPRVKEAFDGRADLVETAALQPSTVPTTAVAQAPATSTSSSKAPTIALVELVVLVAAAAVFLTRRRKRSGVAIGAQPRD